MTNDRLLFVSVQRNLLVIPEERLHTGRFSAAMALRQGPFPEQEGSIQ